MKLAVPVTMTLRMTLGFMSSGFLDAGRSDSQF